MKKSRPYKKRGKVSMSRLLYPTKPAAISATAMTAIETLPDDHNPIAPNDIITNPRLIALIDEGKREGYVDPDLSNESILIFLQMFKENIQKEEVYPHLQKLTEDLTKLFFYGLVGRKDHLIL
jgi:hypothetical protein